MRRPMRMIPAIAAFGACWSTPRPPAPVAPHDPDPPAAVHVPPPSRPESQHWVTTCGDTVTNWQVEIAVDLVFTVSDGEVVAEGEIDFLKRSTQATLRGPNMRETTLVGEIVETKPNGTQWNIELELSFEPGGPHGRFLEVLSTGGGKAVMCDF